MERLRSFRAPKCGAPRMTRNDLTTYGSKGLELKVALDQFAEFFAVFVFHVHELDAIAFGADIADNGREMDFAEAGADLELDGITDVDFLWRLETRATETDGLDARESRLCSVNLRAQGRFERDAGVAALHDEAGIRIAGCGECGASASGCWAIFEHGESVFGGGTEAGGLGVGKSLAAAGEGAKQLGGVPDTHAAQGFNGFDANELIAKNVVSARGDFHELRHSGGFLSEADLVDHHGHDQGMGIREDGGKNEGGALRGCGVGGTSEFADSQILEVPLPTGKRARKTAEEAVGVGGGKKLDGGADALAARFVQARLQQIQNRHADGAHEAGHGREKLGTVGFGEQQSQAIEKAVRIAVQKTRENGIQRAIGQRSVDQEEPAVLRDKTMRERGNMIVGDIVRRLFERIENVFKAGVVAANDGDAPEIFQESREQSGSFRRGFLLERLERTAAQVLGNLIGPERFDDGGKLIEASSDGAPDGSFCAVDAPRVIQQDVAGFAARCVCAGRCKLAEILLKRDNGNAPNIRAAQYRGFFARRKLKPEFLNQLFAMRVGGPGGRKGR